MAKIETFISDPLYTRLKKISDLLDIEFEVILQLCLIDGGYYKYWRPIENFIEDIPDLMDSADSTGNLYDIRMLFKEQFIERDEIIEDINSLEKEFNVKFGHLKSADEQHRAFLDFIDILHTEHLIEEQGLEEPEVRGHSLISQEQQERQEILEEPTIEESSPQEDVGFPIKLLPKKYVPMLLLIVISDFLIIKLAQIFWPSFTFIQILQYNPFQLFPYLMIIIFTSLLSGTLYRHYYNKFKASIPVRREAKELRRVIREFDSKNPHTYSKDPIIQIHNDIKRLQKLEREVRVKKQIN